MKSLIIPAFMGILIVLTGCNESTSGGPGATEPPPPQREVGENENTFTLEAPVTTTNLVQGETKLMTIGIERETNFNQDVEIRFENMPLGVETEPARPVIEHGATEVEFTLRAASDAALGDFVAQIVGHPGTGADALVDFKIAVAESKPDDTVVADPASITERDNYIREMRAELDQLQAKNDELKARASATPEGQAREELEQKLAEANVKLEAAERQLEEVSRAESGWERYKDNVRRDLDDLKNSIQ
jgi:hypothetical protein